MVLTPPMVFAQTDGIESVLLNHTRTRGPSVTCMRDFLNLSRLSPFSILILVRVKVEEDFGGNVMFIVCLPTFVPLLHLTFYV